MLATLTAKALVIAHEDNSDPANYRLLQSVAGIIFFGTPHRGSSVATLGKPFGKMVNPFLKVASAGQSKAIRIDLLRYLESNSKALQELTDSVRHRLGSLQVVSFYETKPEFPSPLVSYVDVSLGDPQAPAKSLQVVVSKISATLEIPTERIYPLNASHRDLCRFPSQNDSEYSIVVSEIRRVATRPPNQTSTHSSQTS